VGDRFVEHKSGETARKRRPGLEKRPKNAVFGPILVANCGTPHVSPSEKHVFRKMGEPFRFIRVLVAKRRSYALFFPKKQLHGHASVAMAPATPIVKRL
jgi:hypothetical protein